MCNKKNTQDIKRTFHHDYEIVNVNLAIPGVYCEKLGKHYSCFIGENLWCEKRPLPNRMASLWERVFFIFNTC